MCSLANLCKDTILLIANHSYRVWQLLKLTCNTYNDLLVCYHKHNNIIFARYKNVVISRSEFITTMFAILASSPTEEYASVRMGHSDVLLESKILQSIPTTIIYRSDFKMCICLDIWDLNGVIMCQIFSSYRPRANIQIRDAVFSLKSRYFHIDTIMEYIHDAIPELYHEIKFI